MINYLTLRKHSDIHKMFVNLRLLWNKLSWCDVTQCYDKSLLLITSKSIESQLNCTKHEQLEINVFDCHEIVADAVSRLQSGVVKVSSLSS